MTTQGEYGDNPHQAVGVGAYDDPRKQTAAPRHRPTSMIIADPYRLVWAITMLVGAIHESPDQNHTKQKRAIRESPLRRNLRSPCVWACNARPQNKRNLNKKPPLCKGRWLAEQDGGIVKSRNQRKTIPQSPSATAPVAQGSLWRFMIYRYSGRSVEIIKIA